MEKYRVTIYFRDGTVHSTYVDSAFVSKGCLIFYKKDFDDNVVERHGIPLDLIKEYIVQDLEFEKGTNNND